MENQAEGLNEGLGLAEAAGIPLDEVGETGFNFLAQFWEYFQADLISSIPITICSFVALTVIYERISFYSRNTIDISRFIQNLQQLLEKGDLASAQLLSNQAEGVIGEVSEEGVRLLAVQKEDFSKAYDVTVAIVTRKLQQRLSFLSTIGAIAPFLGLFGTVSGVIKSLFKMSLGAEGASLTMIGEISNALIATGYGLFIAIVAVVFNNSFNNKVKRFEDDFNLLKLLFMSFSNMEMHYSPAQVAAESPAVQQAQVFQQVDENQKTEAVFIDPVPPKSQQDKPPYPDFLM